MYAGKLITLFWKEKQLFESCLSRRHSIQKVEGRHPCNDKHFHTYPEIIMYLIEECSVGRHILKQTYINIYKIGVYKHLLLQGTKLVAHLVTEWN